MKDKLIVKTQTVVTDHKTALDYVRQGIDLYKGALFSSGFEFPGRHSRWDIGFLNPSLEFILRGDSFVIKSLTEKGSFLLRHLKAKLENHPHGTLCAKDGNSICFEITRTQDFFSEETRSRQPSVFTVLRSILEMFQLEDASNSYFGLFGAFGYDLIRQFEEIESRLPRTAEDKDLHLYLPLTVTVVDRMKEVGFEYNFEVSDKQGSTRDLSSDSKIYPLPAPAGDTSITCDHKPGEFAEKVRKVIKSTAAGDYFEVILSQSFSTRFDHKPSDFFARLSQVTPSPDMFIIN